MLFIPSPSSYQPKNISWLTPPPWNLPHPSPHPSIRARLHPLTPSSPPPIRAFSTDSRLLEGRRAEERVLLELDLAGGLRELAGRAAPRGEAVHAAVTRDAVAVAHGAALVNLRVLFKCEHQINLQQ